jgi:hypothetical protein
MVDLPQDNAGSEEKPREARQRGLGILRVLPSRFTRPKLSRCLDKCRGIFGSAIFFCLASALLAAPVQAQSPDCDRIRSQIAAIDQGGGGRPNSYGSAAQRQQAEIQKTTAYAQSLGCDRGRYSFFGGGQPPQQCNALNARIQAMQANLGQLQGMAARSGGGSSAQRQDLVARYNAYCRSQPRGFFESLFGSGSNAPAQPSEFPEDAMAPEEDDQAARGGSQAICVRTCDGGFFPMNYSARHEGLQDLCHALCPNTETALYTRNPEADVGTAVSSDGQPYRDLQNAFKFQKSFDPACTCKAKGESWVQALAQSDAERVLGQERKGDIIVTPEQSLQMSRPRTDLNVRAKMPVVDSGPVSARPLVNPPPQAASAGKNATPANANEANAAADDPTGSEVVTGPDGVKRRVRRVGPTP